MGTRRQKQIDDALAKYDPNLRYKNNKLKPKDIIQIRFFTFRANFHSLLPYICSGIVIDYSLPAPCSHQLMARLPDSQSGNRGFESPWEHQTKLYFPYFIFDNIMNCSWVDTILLC